jgi:hypothetical protein
MRALREHTSSPNWPSTPWGPSMVYVLPEPVWPYLRQGQHAALVNPCHASICFADKAGRIQPGKCKACSGGAQASQA